MFAKPKLGYRLKRFFTASLIVDRANACELLMHFRVAVVDSTMLTIRRCNLNMMHFAEDEKHLFFCAVVIDAVVAGCRSLTNLSSTLRS